MGHAHVDLAGSYDACVGGVTCLVTPYGIRRKSNVPWKVQRFIADHGAPGCFRSDNGREFTSAEYISIWDQRVIRREYMGGGSPKQNGLVESSITRAPKGGHIGRLEAPLLYPRMKLHEIPTVHTPDMKYFRREHVVWAAKWSKRLATTGNSGMALLHKVHHGVVPRLDLLFLSSSWVSAWSTARISQCRRQNSVIFLTGVLTTGQDTIWCSPNPLADEATPVT